MATQVCFPFPTLFFLLLHASQQQKREHAGNVRVFVRLAFLVACFGALAEASSRSISLGKPLPDTLFATSRMQLPQLLGKERVRARAHKLRTSCVTICRNGNTSTESVHCQHWCSVCPYKCRVTVGSTFRRSVYCHIDEKLLFRLSSIYRIDESW